MSWPRFRTCFNDTDLPIIADNDFIEYKDNFSKKSGSLWQYFRDETTFNVDILDIVDIPSTSNSKSFKFKNRLAGSLLHFKLLKKCLYQ